MSCTEYNPEIDNHELNEDPDEDYEPSSSSEESGDDITDDKPLSKQEETLKNLLKIGELKTENIIEIQMIEKLIQESKYDDIKKLQIGKSLELLINCSNAFLKNLKDQA